MTAENSEIQTTPDVPAHWLRNYLPMWIGQAVSLLGSGLVQFALVWYMTEKTGSATVLAMATFVALLPSVILGPFAGALVDRLNRKAIMIISDTAVALATFALVVLFHLGIAQIWHIYVALFVRSLCGSFQYPAMQASTSLMVPREHFARLGGINQAMNGVITIVSPPLGALLMSVMTMQAVLAIDLVTAAIAISLLALFVRVPQPPRSQTAEALTPARVLADVRNGLKYAVGWSGLFKVMVMASLINMLASPAFSLLPLMVTKIYGKGAAEVAWLESALGLGIVAGGLLLGLWGGFKRKTATTLTGLIGMGAGITVLGLTDRNTYLLAVGMMGLVGLMNALANGALGAIMQTKIPPEMQGRIFTVIGSLASAASPLGMLLAAPVAEKLGIRAWYLIAGVFCAAMGVYGFLKRDVYTLDDQEPGGQLAAVTAAAEELA
ncbi:MAG: MFS transporter [Chloroflexi bacterium]|nr:MFS transporter [Chloroflexota bacterium]